jgi:hypothetical protein
MAPSERSDLYAVGVIAFELFTGLRLFTADDTETLINKITHDIPDTRTITNQPVSGVVARLLSKDPADRYTDADQAIMALCKATDLPVPAETAAIRESFLQAARFVGREEPSQLTETLAGAKGGRQCLAGHESGRQNAPAGRAADAGVYPGVPHARAELHEGTARTRWASRAALAVPADRLDGRRALSSRRSYPTLKRCWAVRYRTHPP